VVREAQMSTRNMDVDNIDEMADDILAEEEADDLLEGGWMVGGWMSGCGWLPGGGAACLYLFFRVTSSWMGGCLLLVCGRKALVSTPALCGLRLEGGCMLLLLLAAGIHVLLGLAGGRCCWTGRVDLAWWELGRVHGIQTGTFGGQAGGRTGASPLLCRFLRHTHSRMASSHHHIITHVPACRAVVDAWRRVWASWPDAAVGLPLLQPQLAPRQSLPGGQEPLGSTQQAAAGGGPMGRATGACPAMFCGMCTLLSLPFRSSFLPSLSQLWLPAAVTHLVLCPFPCSSASSTATPLRPSHARHYYPNSLSLFFLRNAPRLAARLPPFPLSSVCFDGSLSNTQSLDNRTHARRCAPVAARMTSMASQTTVLPFAHPGPTP
jgi:hypothetical protein